MEVISVKKGEQFEVNFQNMLTGQQSQISLKHYQMIELLDEGHFVIFDQITRILSLFSAQRCDFCVSSMPLPEKPIFKMTYNRVSRTLHVFSGNNSLQACLDYLVFQMVSDEKKIPRLEQIFSKHFNSLTRPTLEQLNLCGSMIHVGPFLMKILVDHCSREIELISTKIFYRLKSLSTNAGFVAGETMACNEGYFILYSDGILAALTLDENTFTLFPVTYKILLHQEDGGGKGEEKESKALIVNHVKKKPRISDENEKKGKEEKEDRLISLCFHKEKLYAISSFGKLLRMPNKPTLKQVKDSTVFFETLAILEYSSFHFCSAQMNVFHRKGSGLSSHSMHIIVHLERDDGHQEQKEYLVDLI